MTYRVGQDLLRKALPRFKGLAALQELQFRFPTLFRQIQSTPY